jgi:hypothetical protein
MRNSRGVKATAITGDKRVTWGTALKRLLLATTALLGFVGAATAADLAPRFVPAPPAFTWTGIYVGASVGASFNDSNDDRGGPPPSDSRLAPVGRAAPSSP